MDQLSAHLDRGWDLVTKGDLAGAMLSAQEGLEIQEDSPEAHTLLGYVYAARGQLEQALDHYRAALDAEEGYVDAMLHMAELLLFSMRDLDAALEIVREAQEWLAEDELDERADAILLEVEIHLERGDREAARKTAADLPDGPFENPAIALSVGRALVDVGEIDRAEPLLISSLEVQPTGDGHYYMGLVHEARESPRETVLSFLRAREADQVAPPPPWALEPQVFEQRVQSALGQLAPKLSAALEGALVVVTDLPGPELVADGFDPRAPVLLDGLPASDAEGPPRVPRVFVYRKNVERLVNGLLDVDAEIASSLAQELVASFPQLEEPPAEPSDGNE